MTESEIRDTFSETNPEALLADGFEEAFIGVSRRCGQPDLATYSVSKCLAILMKRDGMSHEEAVEFFEFNVSGAWFGTMTPAWLYDEE